MLPLCYNLVTTTPNSIPLTRLSLFPICAGVTPMQVLLFSGLNSCGVVIPAPSKNRALWWFTTHRDKPTLFQVRLGQHGIQHKVIRPYTPRHNGKVERSHRKDNERFYATHTFYSFEDFAKQLKVYNQRDYNTFPIRPLGWKSPNEVLRGFFTVGVTCV